jgi:hypothetical protein
MAALFEKSSNVNDRPVLSPEMAPHMTVTRFIWTPKQTGRLTVGRNINLACFRHLGVIIVRTDS